MDHFQNILDRLHEHTFFSILDMICNLHRVHLRSWYKPKFKGMVLYTFNYPMMSYGL
jgi:hypothetical protein